MLITEDFAKSITAFTLRFKSDDYEKEYMQSRHLINNFHQVLKWIIIIYSLVIWACLLGVTIYFFTTYGNTKPSLYLAGVFVSCTIGWGVELVCSFFSVTRYLRGVYTINVAIVGYRFALEALGVNRTTLPGDIAIVTMLALVGMYYCYNWLIASISFATSLAGFMLVGVVEKPSFQGMIQ